MSICPEKSVMPGFSGFLFWQSVQQKIPNFLKTSSFFGKKARTFQQKWSFAIFC